MVKMVASRNIQKFKDTEIRIEALNAASRVYTGKSNRSSTADVIEAAKKFEEYLKGQV